MVECPKCGRKLLKVFHGEPDDDMAIESLNGEIIIGNCCESQLTHYCENCDEFFSADCAHITGRYPERPYRDWNF